MEEAAELAKEVQPRSKRDVSERRAGTGRRAAAQLSPASQERAACRWEEPTALLGWPLSPSAPALLLSEAEARHQGVGLTQGDAECQGHVAKLQAFLWCLQFLQQCHQLVAESQLRLLVPCGHSQGQRPVLPTQADGSGLSEPQTRAGASCLH